MSDEAVEQATKDVVRWYLHDYDDGVRVYVRVQGRIVRLSDAKPTGHPTDDYGIVLDCLEEA